MLLFNKKPDFTPALDLNELKSYRYRPKDLLVIDTETVGSAGLIEIKEICIINLAGEVLLNEIINPVYNNNFRDLADKESFVKKNSLNPKAKNCLASGKFFAQNIYQDYLRITKDKLIVAYNASFDKRVIAAEFSRIQAVEQSEEIGWRCAMATVKSVLKLKKAPKLEDIFTALNLNIDSPQKWHTAEWDVKATIKILEWLIDK